ncbi:MAG TPA: response regulator [Terracidiphilus sp.]|nr:response regulator [Terracidiphilus sp.]
MATILLVDNDPLQAFVRKSILEKRFQNVQRVSDPAEAFCMVEQPQFADDLALVITGPQMPGMNAPAFAAELHARLPRVLVLVLGGDDQAPPNPDADGVRFLPRPFASEEMLEVASQLMGQFSR